MGALLVEDDQMMGAAIAEGLEPHFRVEWVRNLADAEVALRVGGHDFMVLDLGLPDGSGLDLLRAERRRGNMIPVLILTARGELDDRLAGLNSGADDYLVKPFDLPELIARCEAIMRRLRGSGSPVIRHGPLTYEPATRTVTLDGQPLLLSARELAVLDLLLIHHGRVVSKAQIEQHLYDLDAEIESNTVEVYISRLRRKIGHDMIVTMRGLGYVMPRNA
ncbi:response regulator transcription factor [Novosphingobium sp. KCTC 2891]|uniref:response regulator n=1 Tax=Novosphingobium sp. KCTC 2891 TaxID=2989730 RepID=UPI002222ED53|nr:response regulator transcription factor [Novosphingobium sp. KCTC 2891]MCW1382530.1 response regulator transcription factor [Novosphingobium sp. KCTC 2891]